MRTFRLGLVPSPQVALPYPFNDVMLFQVYSKGLLFLLKNGTACQTFK